MKMIVVLAALVAVALAAPAQEQPQTVLVKETLHDNIGTPTGYTYGFELSDGQSRQEQAQFEDATDEEGKPTQALRVTGSYSFVAANGQQYVVEYVADQSGFHPQGAHLPA